MILHENHHDRNIANTNLTTANRTVSDSASSRPPIYPHFPIHKRTESVNSQASLMSSITLPSSTILTPSSMTSSSSTAVKPNPSLLSTMPLYTCHVVYLGCRDCELLSNPAAIERSISSLLNNENQQFQNSSLIELKLQRSGVTLTDGARKLFFRKHFNKKLLKSCFFDPVGRTVNVAAYWYFLGE